MIMSTPFARPVMLALSLGGLLTASQPTLDLRTLTVPEGRLPPDCRPLAVPLQRALIGPDGPTLVHAEDAALPSLPWQGNDRRTLASIRRVVDGTPPLPDGPPLDADGTIAHALRWADDVVEGYGSVYVEAGTRIGVYAIRFKDATLATTEPPKGTSLLGYGPSERIVLGSTVVRIVAPRPVKCFQAISTYVSSLK